MRRTQLRAVVDGERVKAKRPRSTGPRAVERLVIVARAGGSCELCGVPVALVNDDGQVTPLVAYSIHHRQPRGMGGSGDPAVNSAVNLLLLCGTGTTGCHGMVESQRALAVTHGWIVPRPTDPATVPVRLFFGDDVYLTPTGTYQEVFHDPAHHHQPDHAGD